MVSILPDDLIYRDLDIAKALDEETGYLALFTPRELGMRNKWARRGGWTESKGGFFSSYGGAYVYSTEAAKKILASDFFINHHDNYQKNQQIDHCIPECCHQLGLKQYFHCPSVAKHIGLTSTIGHTHTNREDPFGW